MTVLIRLILANLNVVNFSVELFGVIFKAVHSGGSVTDQDTKV